MVRRLATCAIAVAIVVLGLLVGQGGGPAAARDPSIQVGTVGQATSARTLRAAERATRVARIADAGAVVVGAPVRVSEPVRTLAPPSRWPAAPAIVDPTVPSAAARGPPG